VIRKNSIRTEHLCDQQLSKLGTKLRLEAIQNVTMRCIELRRRPHGVFAEDRTFFNKTQESSWKVA
jgi:hypothetical protein